METYIFKSIILLFIIGCGFVRFPLMRKCRNNNTIKSFYTDFEKIKVFIAWLGMCFIPFIYVFTNLLKGFDINIPLAVRIISAIGLTGNIFFFYYIHKELDDNWSAILEIKEGQKLVKTGIYKYIRHPMYTQSWLWVILTGIVAANSFVLVFGIVTWGFMYFTRVYNEEKIMTEEFGDEYTNYMNQTGRLLPKINFKQI